jgi:hypothetical protein
MLGLILLLRLSRSARLILCRVYNVSLGYPMLQKLGDKHEGSAFLFPLNSVPEQNGSCELVARHMHETIVVYFSCRTCFRYR